VCPLFTVLINITMLIVDDLISKTYQEEIKQTLLDIKFPWGFIPDVTSAGSDINAPALIHNYRWSGNTHSPYFDIIEPIARLGAGAVDYKYSSVIQARSFLQFPLNTKFFNKETDLLHIDLDYSHLVVLYYVLDSDGDTLITNKTFDQEKKNYLDIPAEEDIVLRVTPKQGRAVIFDGKYYHTAQQPKDKLRCIINFNIE